MNKHRLFDLAREFGPQVGPVSAHLNAAEIFPIEFDRDGNHLYAIEALEHLRSLTTKETNEPSTDAQIFAPLSAHALIIDGNASGSYRGRT